MLQKLLPQDEQHQPLDFKHTNTPPTHKHFQGRTTLSRYYTGKSLRGANSQVLPRHKKRCTFIFSENSYRTHHGLHEIHPCIVQPHTTVLKARSLHSLAEGNVGLGSNKSVQSSSRNDKRCSPPHSYQSGKRPFFVLEKSPCSLPAREAEHTSSLQGDLTLLCSPAFRALVPPRPGLNEISFNLFLLLGVRKPTPEKCKYL